MARRTLNSIFWQSPSHRQTISRSISCATYSKNEAKFFARRPEHQSFIFAFSLLMVLIHLRAIDGALLVAHAVSNQSPMCRGRCLQLVSFVSARQGRAFWTQRLLLWRSSSAIFCLSSSWIHQDGWLTSNGVKRLCRARICSARLTRSCR